MSEPTVIPAAQDLDFEAAFRALEATVLRLEAGDLSLDAALGEYERGVALAGRCGQLLADADQKLSEIGLGQAGGEI